MLMEYVNQHEMRNRVIFWAHHFGVTYTAIGEFFGISKERSRQIEYKQARLYGIKHYRIDLRSHERQLEIWRSGEWETTKQFVEEYAVRTHYRRPSRIPEE